MGELVKKILVTGANRGIGLEVCRQLDRMGHEVILCTRDLSKGREAARSLSPRATVMQLDVTREEQIQSLYQALKSGGGKLDVLINNAGLAAVLNDEKEPAHAGMRDFIDNHLKGVGKMARRAAPLLRKAGILPRKGGAAGANLRDVKRLMETNFYGAWRMIQVFLPLLLKSTDGRIINVSSGNGQLSGLSAEYPEYSLSKAALNALTIMLAGELKNKSIKVNALCPGWVKTDMGGPHAPREVEEGADTVVWLATEKKISSGKFYRDRQVIDW